MALGIASGARQLLAAFGVNRQRNHLDNGETANTVYMLALPADITPAQWDLYFAIIWLRKSVLLKCQANGMPPGRPSWPADVSGSCRMRRNDHRDG